MPGRPLVGPVLVACAEEEIAEAVRTAGGKALLTHADHPSGSDRVFEAVEAFDPEGAYDAIVNLQGDLPALDPSAVEAVFQPLQNVAVDIATLVAEITDEDELEDENAVYLDALSEIDLAIATGNQERVNHRLESVLRRLRHNAKGAGDTGRQGSDTPAGG